MNPERVFLVLALAFGTAFLLITPPFTAPDEFPHFARAYQISEARLSVTGAGNPASVPRSLAQLQVQAERWWPWRKRTRVRDSGALVSLLRQPLAPADRVYIKNRSLYSPVAYAAPAIALLPARLLEPSPLLLVYVARAANLIAWIGLVWLAIRLAPVRRWALCALCLMPMTLFQAAVVSADALTNGLAILFATWVAHVAFVESARLERADAAGLVTVAALLGLAKPGYWPLAAAVLCIPAPRFAGAARRFAFWAAVGVAAVLPSLLWLAYVRAAEAPVPHPVANPEGQIRYVLGNPLAMLDVFTATLRAKLHLYVMSFVGVLGRLDIFLPRPLYFVYPAALVALAVADGTDPPALSPGRRLAFVALFLAGSASMMLVGYVGWNEVGAATIEGIQGRYFLPMAPLLLFALPSRRWGRFALGEQPVWIVALVTSGLGVATFALLRRMWGLWAPLAPGS